MGCHQPLSARVTTMAQLFYAAPALRLPLIASASIASSCAL